MQRKGSPRLGIISTASTAVTIIREKDPQNATFLRGRLAVDNYRLRSVFCEVLLCTTPLYSTTVSQALGNALRGGVVAHFRQGAYLHAVP